jgi:hypothetical protein
MSWYSRQKGVAITVRKLQGLIVYQTDEITSYPDCTIANGCERDRLRRLAQTIEVRELHRLRALRNSFGRRRAQLPSA